ncbi:YuzD family protein [Bacillus sp. FJAT-47783]|uniref:YuzD family protein n=1 Tax=Bacillus sp. FJAT-47783 TaxID=2922712 RepID=UPI001FAC511C|nr:YuzD family protein [Bacillus sp. FJAT-47783]
MSKMVEICVFGAEVLCPSCVNLPSSKETYEWLEAALKRKYPDQPFQITYIDIHAPSTDEEKMEIVEKILNDEYFYPLVTINGVVVGEGSPRLKTIYSEMEKHGYKPKEESGV